jgi:hypothetical protein
MRFYPDVMGFAWWVQPPACPVHKGPMRYDPVMSRWECRGWDGEGCGHTVRDEDLERGEIGEISTIDLSTWRYLE